MLRLTPAEEAAIRRQWPSVLRSASLPPMAGKEPADFRPEKPAPPCGPTSLPPALTGKRRFPTPPPPRTA